MFEIFLSQIKTFYPWLLRFCRRTPDDDRFRSKHEAFEVYGSVVLEQSVSVCQLYARGWIPLNCWIKIDQLDVTCFVISLFNAQHVSNVSTSILRSLRLICWVISWVVLLWFDVCWCYGVVRLGWSGILMQAEAVQYNTWNKSTISRKLLKTDVLTFETRWAVNSEIIKQVTSSWSIFIQLSVTLST